jgi:hypothetical protein
MNKNTDNKIDADGLEKMIQAAKSEPVSTGLHVTETIPNVLISAGISNKVTDFVLLHDASNIKARKGPNSLELLKIVKDQCGALKVPGMPREK